jgi:Kef-type K+ transport system membrane component KefB
VVTSMQGMSGTGEVLLLALHEIGGAVLLGVVIGLPAAFLTGRIRPGEPMLTEALGLVFICCGAAIALQVSFLIAAMVMGAVVANLARHHEYPFHAIEGVEWPFMALFFVLAGASLEIQALLDIGLLALVYIVCRIAGKIFGAWSGGILGGASLRTRCWMGLALLPQAGAAIGMALVAVNRFPEYRQVMLPLVISSTIFFELVGPLLTRLALQRGRPVS